MKVNVKDLNKYELIFLAEDLICVLNCKAHDDDEYETPDDLIKENLRKAPVVLDMIGWHDDANTVRKISLENINTFGHYLWTLEFKLLPYTDDEGFKNLRPDLFFSYEFEF